jgi:hypothetical protein
VGRQNKPYRELWASVLEKALEDLSYDPPETRENLTTYQDSKVNRELYWKRQAQAWFKSRSRGFNSFEGICLILELEASQIRKKLFEKRLL